MKKLSDSAILDLHRKGTHPYQNPRQLQFSARCSMLDDKKHNAKEWSRRGRRLEKLLAARAA